MATRGGALSLLAALAACAAIAPSAEASPEVPPQGAAIWCYENTSEEVIAACDTKLQELHGAGLSVAMISLGLREPGSEAHKFVGNFDPKVIEALGSEATKLGMKIVWRLDAPQWWHEYMASGFDAVQLYEPGPAGLCECQTNGSLLETLVPTLGAQSSTLAYYLADDTEYSTEEVPQLGEWVARVKALSPAPLGLIGYYPFTVGGEAALAGTGDSETFEIYPARTTPSPLRPTTEKVAREEKATMKAPQVSTYFLQSFVLEGGGLKSVYPSAKEQLEIRDGTILAGEPRLMIWWYWPDELSRRAQLAEVAKEPYPAAPVNNQKPTVEGTPKEGATLTANEGTWSGGSAINVIKYKYKWKYCVLETVKGKIKEKCTVITGATSKTYKVENQLGRTIRVLVTAENMYGKTNAESASTGIVQP